MAINSFQNGEYGVGPVYVPPGYGGIAVASIHTSPPDIVTPPVPAASQFVVNTINGGQSDVMVYITAAGTGASIIIVSNDTNTQLQFNITAGRTCYLPAGWSIGLGAYTAAPSWTWVAV